jgi:hypothetical protein
MNEENLSLIFRVLLGCFLLSLLLSMYHAFGQKGKKRIAIYLGIVCLLIFIGLVYIVVFSANIDIRQLVAKSEDKVNPYSNNLIYQDISFILAIGVRLALIGVITMMLYYLWRKSKKYPNNMGIKIHKALLLLGFVGIGYFIFHETKGCLESLEYREVLPFGLYAAFFAGGMFWMFICSIIAAAALPENKDK